MAIKNWYKNDYRRNLVDMHIEDWSEEFLSRFDADEYVSNLKKAHIQAPMIYLQSHVGHCYWPTKSGHMHAALKGREDMIKRLVDACHAEGMHVVGYYSLIYNTVEEDKHPEWRLFGGEDGLSSRMRGGRYGHLCPSNRGYVEFVKTQIAEMAEYFDLDGMFYDMTFWPAVCKCESCKRRYLAETGSPMLEGDELKAFRLPEVNWADEKWLEFQKMRVKWMGEFAKEVTDETKRLIPNVTVEHNYAMAVAGDNAVNCSTELVNDQCDYSGGDLYGDLYNHSFTAKYYYGATRNQPFEYMTCRCDNRLAVHTITKTEEHLSVEVMLTAAHHGASLVIDAIDPRGTLDSRVYDRLGKVFERQLPYERYFRGDMVTDVGVYYSTTGRYNSRGMNFTNKTCAVSLTRTLIEENVAVGVVCNRAPERLKLFKIVFAPQIAGLYDDDRQALVDYVNNGGTLYISGAEDKALLNILLGASVEGYTEETAVYMAPTDEGRKYFGEFNADYPFPTETSLARLSFADMSDITTLAVMTLPYTKPSEGRFASIHTNPPGIATAIPAMVTRPYGKGRVIWSAAPIENDRRSAYKRLTMSLLYGYADRDSFAVRSNAPRQVELVTFRGEKEMLVSAVDLLCTDELLKVNTFEVAVACEKPISVTRLASKDRADSPIDFTCDGKYVRFAVEDLVMFDMFRIVQEI